MPLAKPSIVGANTGFQGICGFVVRDALKRVLMELLIKAAKRMPGRLDPSRRNNLKEGFVIPIKIGSHSTQQ